MAFPASGYRSTVAAPTRRRTPAVVFAVGRRVFVACSAAHLARVTLTDDSGGTARGSLRDGTEVEIVAWRPHGPQGTRYLVRSPSKNVEGWLGAAEVRRCKAKPAREAAVLGGKAER